MSETPLAWFRLAHVYLYDAATLSTAPKPGGGHYEAPVRFLYFHSIELFLKAYLRLKDVKESKLRYPPYGHDLTSLADKAAELGLFIGKRVRLVCDAAGDFDDPVEARYIRTGPRQVLLIHKLHEAARDLQSAVEQSLQASGVLMHPLPKLPVVHPPRHLTLAKAARLLARRIKV